MLPSGSVGPPGSSYFSSPASLQHFHQPHPHHLAYSTGQRHAKRKSAVELLAESKPLYVKSETVLDRDQQLFRGNTPSAMRKDFFPLLFYFSGVCVLKLLHLRIERFF